MRVVTFNLHAGVDGWGRPSGVLELVTSLAANVYVLPELWRGDDGPDFFEDLRHTLSLDGAFAPLTTAHRVTSGSGDQRWQPRSAHWRGERGLFFEAHRPLSERQRALRDGAEKLEHGTWGLGLLTTFDIEDVTVVPLGRLPREKVQRAFIVARLRDADRSFYVVAVHGAHLSHGSFLQYRRISAYVRALEPNLPVLIAGDFNCWRPLLRLLLPGWKTLARARTWPTPRPHSQIDHVLGRGPWRPVASYARDGGSDHFALVAEVELVT